MHSRNPYRIPPDFVSLAQAYSPLQQFLINTEILKSPDNASGRRITIDFKNDKALRCLTQAILFRDFGIQLQIPEDRLCPPVPNRMNYVLWIQDIMKASGTLRSEETTRCIHGIDIGTGATVIYPFLACSLEKNWQMIGTELDDKSYECALRNVEINNFDGRITIKQAQTTSAILFPLEDEAASYDFTMCNPPFYSSAQQMNDLSKEKAGLPNAVCTGSSIEMIYPDRGEVGFVIRMVEESIRFQGRCSWYTSMLGRMSSVIEIIEIFQKRNISNYAVTEFVQGQTRRWAIGWSFSEIRLPDSISRLSLHQSHALAPFMPLHTTLCQTLRLPTTTTYNCVARRVRDVLDAIEEVRVTEYKDNHQSSSFRIEAKENTWSRSARRKMKRRKLELGEEAEDKDRRRADNIEGQSARQHSNLKLVCDVHIIVPENAPDTNFDLHTTRLEVQEDIDQTKAPHSKSQNRASYSLECQWIFGTDHAVFESFASHIGRKLIEFV